MAHRLGIVGASGYGGAELLRLLGGPPGASRSPSSRPTRRRGRPSPTCSRTSPATRVFDAVDLDALGGCDAVVLADAARRRPRARCGAVRRRRPRSSTCRPPSGSSVEGFATWYGEDHPRPDLAAGDPAADARAVYGLPELGLPRRDPWRDAWWPTPGATRRRRCSGSHRCADLLVPGQRRGRRQVGHLRRGPRRQGHAALRARARRPHRLRRARPPPHRRDRAVAARPTSGPSASPRTWSRWSRGLLATAYGDRQRRVDAADVQDALARPPTTTSRSCTSCRSGTFPHTKALAGSNGCQLSAVVDPRTAPGHGHQRHRQPRQGRGRPGPPEPQPAARPRGDHRPDRRSGCTREPVPGLGAEPTAAGSTPVDGGVTAVAGLPCRRRGQRRQGVRQAGPRACSSPTSPRRRRRHDHQPGQGPGLHACSERHAADGRARAVVINSGNANVCTPDGEAHTERIAEAAAAATGLDADRRAGACRPGSSASRSRSSASRQRCPPSPTALTPDGGDAAAEAMLTTDTRTKQVAFRVTDDQGTLHRRGDGQGRRHDRADDGDPAGGPRPPTRRSTPRILRSLLRRAVDTSFNRISVDGDRSTSDTDRGARQRTGDDAARGRDPRPRAPGGLRRPGAPGRRRR